MWQEFSTFKVFAGKPDNTRLKTDNRLSCNARPLVIGELAG